jgi:hypothetical protein
MASSQLGAIIVLAIGAWVHPAFAATAADARCDQPIDAPPMSAASESKLSIQVIDHGTSAAVASDPESSDGPRGPRVDIILRRIFDEAQLRQPQLAGPEHADDLATPFAVDKTEAIEEPATVLDSEQSDVAAELPGFSADELLHYRQQMFRKDI